MRYAILTEDKTVENIIEADDAFVKAAYSGRWVKLSDGQWCDMGATYDAKAKAFTAAEA